MTVRGARRQEELGRQRARGSLAEHYHIIIIIIIIVIMRGACRQEELERQRAAKVESAEVRRPPAPEYISDTWCTIL